MFWIGAARAANECADPPSLGKPWPAARHWNTPFTSIYLRSLFLSMAKGTVIPENEAGAHAPLHCITDCKSLFDHIHREGAPKAPSEKRLAIDLAGLRQVLTQEAKHLWMKNHSGEPTPDQPCRPPIHWVPTEVQLADVLTKEMKPNDWWAMINKGMLQLPFKSRRDRPCKDIVS